MKTEKLSAATNDAKDRIEAGRPYTAIVEVTGVAPIIFHRWSPEDHGEKQRARKGSSASKVDNVETYVWRDKAGNLCLPGENLRMAMIGAAKYRKDPRSPRANATALFKAGVVVTTELASFGVQVWDYLDTRRAIVQRAGIQRVRPALQPGWVLTFELSVILPEYIDPTLLQEVIADAGRFCGFCEMRPTYGRFQVTRFEIKPEV